MLRLKGLSCGYGPMRAVHGFDLDVAERGITVLLGACGWVRGSCNGAFRRGNELLAEVTPQGRESTPAVLVGTATAQPAGCSD